MPRIGVDRRPQIGAMDESLEHEVSVVDVYDIASDIGKECEKIIDKFGADAVTALMPKVINALELLEHLATRNERENAQMYDLQTKISQLENDKLEKAEYREKFERDLEVIEDQWRTDTKELVGLVSKLQEENQRLAKQQEKQSGYEVQSPSEVPHDAAMLQRLQASLEKQRDEIRSKEKLLQDRCCDIEMLRTQVDRLNGTSRELRRKHKVLQGQVRTLCEERADFLVQLQDQQRDITLLRGRLGVAVKENEDLAQCDYSLPGNKAVYDLDDPNRPRFTTTELKDILNERNELKAKVSDLEDELETYRPKKQDAVVNPRSSFFSSISGFLSIAAEIDEDAPVQGPLPYEPDDAPWKKSSQESGIRKFFRKIFTDNGSGSGPSFPRRSLSTLSKMALSASTATTTEPISV